MFRTVIISSEPDFSANVRTAVEDSGLCIVVRTLDPHAANLDFVATVRGLRPQLVILNSDDSHTAISLAREIRDTMAATQMMAAGRKFDPETMMELSDFGVLEFVGHPFVPALVREALIRTAKRRSIPAQSRVIDFARTAAPNVCTAQRYNGLYGDPRRHSRDFYWSGV